VAWTPCLGGTGAARRDALLGCPRRPEQGRSAAGRGKWCRIW